METIACVFVISMATLTYLYGSYRVVPEVLSFYNYGTLLLNSLRLLATWVLFAVFSNFYLIRKRNSSIRHRMLMQPVVKPMAEDIISMSPEVQLREKTKHMGEHFKEAPYGETRNWHICGVCEVFVPPRAWHCHSCDTCILRRDHHCIFTGCCIGEENQSNFMGLLFYLGFGTSVSAFFSVVYFLWVKEMALWWFLVRSLMVLYSIFFDFSIEHILASVNSIGQLAAWGVFFYYVALSLKGQTSADAHRKIFRATPTGKRWSYDNMRNFLGPNPLLRILWPFHQPFKTDYGLPDINMENDRKGL